MQSNDIQFFIKTEEEIQNPKYVPVCEINEAILLNSKLPALGKAKSLQTENNKYTINLLKQLSCPADIPSQSSGTSSPLRRTLQLTSAHWLQKLQSSVESSFFCKICMEMCPKKILYSLSGHPCEHEFCKDCLGELLRQQICDGKIKHKCPEIEEECTNFSTEKDIEALCGIDILEKYQRFVKLSTNGDHRECPFCGHLQVGDGHKPAMQCENCQSAFCFFHANAHPPYKSCSEYSRSLARKEKETVAELKKISKNCPRCNMPVEKDGGCDHMTCKCGADWCWVCGRLISNRSNVFAHYVASMWNMTGCAGAHLLDAVESSALIFPCYRIFLAFMMIVESVLIFTLYVPMLLLTLPISACLKPKELSDYLAFPAVFSIVLASLLIFAMSLILAAALSILISACLVTLSPGLFIARALCNANITLQSMWQNIKAPFMALLTLLRDILHVPI